MSLSNTDKLLLSRIITTGNCWEHNYCCNPTVPGCLSTVTPTYVAYKCPLYNNGCAGFVQHNGVHTFIDKVSDYNQVAAQVLAQNCTEEELFDLLI